MNLSHLVSRLGPQIFAMYLDTQRGLGVPPEQLEKLAEVGQAAIDGFADAMLKKEHVGDAAQKAHFVAHLAGELLRGWPGEPTQDAADSAVRIAKRIVDQSEKACAPARSASPPAG